MENIEKFEDYFPEEEKINFRKIFVVILRNWYLFLIFGFLGMVGAYLYNLRNQPDYQVKAAIYAPQKTSGIGEGLNDLFKMQLTNSKSEVYNQIEILKSININKQAAQNLGWRTSWFRKERFNWSFCYKNEPFSITTDEISVNIPGIRIFIHPISEIQYEISAEGNFRYQGIKKQIKIHSQGMFDQPFVHEFFHFTLHPIAPVKTDEIYYFVFNDASSIAREYLSRLIVKLNDKQSEIILLQLTGKQPERDIDYLNQLISSYMLNKMSYQTETQKKSLNFLDSQLSGITDSLNSASTNFTQFRSHNQIINIGEQGTQVMTTLKEIETQKNKNKMQLEYFRNLLQYLGRSDAIRQLIAPSVVGIEDGALNAMVVKLSELYSQRQILSFSARENNPALMMLEEKISQINIQLKENLRNLIQNAEVLNSSLDHQLSTINNQLSRLPQKEQDLINYQRRFDMTNSIYTFLLQKRAEIDIALAGATPEVQIIDAASPDTTNPVGLSHMTILMIGLFLGLIIPGSYLFILNIFSDTIQTQEDIEKNTQLAVLGNVIHSRTKSETAIHDNPRSGIAESYRGIRTNLKFMLTDESKKIISVQSTNPGEGKSFTSVNLATILAMNEKKVLLIGTDMRKPKVHKIFQIKNENGLSTYLSGQNTVQEVIVPTFIDNLEVIPGGPIPPNPSELLDKPELGKLIQQLSTHYDYILLDNAPVSLVTDGLLAGRHADLNIFILRYGVSKKDQINFINQIAEKKILGNMALIINDIKGPGFGYGKNYSYNYRYSGYGHGYYYQEDISFHKSWFRRLQRIRK